MIVADKLRSCYVSATNLSALYPEYLILTIFSDVVPDEQIKRSSFAQCIDTSRQSITQTVDLLIVLLQTFCKSLFVKVNI